MAEKCCRRRTSIKDTSLYANYIQMARQRAIEGHRSRRPYLLAKADTRARIEREEDERVRREVLLHSLVEESVRVELQRYKDEVPSIHGSNTWKSMRALAIWTPEILAPVHHEDGVNASGSTCQLYMNCSKT